MVKKDLSQYRKDYQLSSLQEKNLAATPFLQFDTWFQEAEKFGGFEPNAMCLSTTNQQSRPSSRIVLLKKYGNEGFTFFTNYESKKGKELMEQPFASILFFWEAMQRQIRIEGKVQKISREDSDNYFQSRPIGSQIAAASSPQSQIIKSREVLEKRCAEYRSQQKIETPIHWGGFCLVPDYFEFWQGGNNRLHDRLFYQLNTDNNLWTQGRLAP